MTEWLFQASVKMPEKQYIVSSDTIITYYQAETYVRGIMDFLMDNGISKKMHVAIFSKNNVTYILLIHALARLGTTIIPINYRLATRQIEDQLKQTDTSILVTDRELAIPGIKQIQMQDIKGAFLKYNGEPISNFADSLAQFIFFTSGTTGKSKAACLTMGNIFHNAVGSKTRLRITDSDKWVLSLPLYHVGGISIVFRTAIYGITVVLVKNAEISNLQWAISNQKATILSLVPTMLYRYLRNGFGGILSQLRVLLLGGAKTTESLAKMALENSINLYTTYGLTEAASQVATAIPDEVKKYPQTVGKPIEGMEITIANSTNTQGEILVRGPCVMKGYYKDQESTEKAIDKEGWLHTGDIGYIENGLLFTLGRRNDLIVCGGENIYPAEIEAHLQTIEGIKEACVIGIPEEEWGEIVVAIVVPAKGRDLDHLKMEIVESTKKSLGSFKKPREIIFLDSLPKTSTGKIIRKKLRGMILKNRNSQSKNKKKGG